MKAPTRGLVYEFLLMLVILIAYELVVWVFGPPFWVTLSGAIALGVLWGQFGGRAVIWLRRR